MVRNLMTRQLRTWKHQVCFMTLGALMVFLLSGCIKAQGRETKEIIVFAATSLTESFTAIEEKYEADHQDIDIIYNFAGSQTLTSQIEAGGNPDCFFSANTKYPLELIDESETIGLKTLTEEDMKVFATNELTIIINGLENLETVEELFAAIVKNDLKIVVAIDSAPVGKYTKNLLSAYSEGGFEEEVENFYDHIISYENDVKSVVAKVQMKEADIGLVYKTDLVNVDLSTIEIPAEFNQVGTYGSLLLKDTDEVQEFYDYILIGEGKEILGKFNFGR